MKGLKYLSPIFPEENEQTQTGILACLLLFPPKPQNRWNKKGGGFGVGNPFEILSVYVAHLPAFFLGRRRWKSDDPGAVPHKSQARVVRDRTAACARDTRCLSPGPRHADRCRSRATLNPGEGEEAKVFFTAAEETEISHGRNAEADVLANATEMSSRRLS